MDVITAPGMPGLVLAPMARNDLATFVALYTDPCVMAHVAAPLSAQQARAGFDLALRENAGLGGAASWWSVRHRMSGDRCGLVGTRRQDSEVELGVLLLPGAQRRGIARQALQALIAAGIAHGWTGTLVLHHAPHNAAMRAVASASGFTRVEAAIPDGRRGASGLPVDRVRWERNLATAFASRPPQV